jgi:hypothetical protein
VGVCVGGYAGSGRLTTRDCVCADTSMSPVVGAVGVVCGGGGGGGGGDAGVSTIGILIRFSDGRVHVDVCVAVAVGVCVGVADVCECVGVGVVSARITITGS